MDCEVFMMDPWLMIFIALIAFWLGICLIIAAMSFGESTMKKAMITAAALHQTLAEKIKNQ